ncbi:unnamed protein product [Auanema sp. JU1783]|nr:unnamed protein product [Auanema sp. JU1783]
MLIPVCCQRLPVRMEVKIICAKGLPVMNRSSNTTDAYVDFEYVDLDGKTEIVTSLNPEWNFNLDVIDTDEKEMAENQLQFRVMDYDSYSTNDAIGRVDMDCSIIVEKMRMKNEEIFSEVCTLPIFDSINGFCGELVFDLKIQLLIQFNYKNYVQIFTDMEVPSHHKVTEVGGILGDLKCVVDPDHEWIDRIRSNRATNSARLSIIRENLRLCTVNLAMRSAELNFNIIVGFKEYVDFEEPSSHLITIRVIGSALKSVPTHEPLVPFLEKILFPIYTISSLPFLSQEGIGGLVATKAIHLLDDDDEDPESVRKSWWCEMRSELNQQALSLGCNAVVGYTEQLQVFNGLALLICSGTAINIDYMQSTKLNLDFYQGEDSMVELDPRSLSQLEQFILIQRPCQFLHSTLKDPEMTKTNKMIGCSKCGSNQVPAFVITTTAVPRSSLLLGTPSYLQVCIAKKTLNYNDSDECGQELTNALPFMDHELFNRLITESKNLLQNSNGLFNLRFVYLLSDEQLICVATGLVARLTVYSTRPCTTPTQPGIGLLQKQNDARRFSWSSVRDAIRFRTPISSPGVSVKTISLNLLNKSTEGNPDKRKNLWTDVLRRRHIEKERIGQLLFEKQMSAHIGYIDGRAAQNGNTIAGIHITSNVHTFLRSTPASSKSAYLGRWSDIAIRENDVQDVYDLEQFIVSTIDGLMSYIRKLVEVDSADGVATNFEIHICKFTVSNQKAHLILTTNCSIYSA